MERAQQSMYTVFSRSPTHQNKCLYYNTLTKPSLQIVIFPTLIASLSVSRQFHHSAGFQEASTQALTLSVSFAARSMLLLTTVAFVAILLTPALAALSEYRCPPSGHRRVLSNYGGNNFRLELAPENSSYLQASMDCQIQVLGYESSRWLITIDHYDLDAYQAEFSVREDNFSGKQVIIVNSAGTVYRQFGVGSGSFSVRLITKGSPRRSAKGAGLTIEHLGRGECPSGWYTVPGSSGYCYGVPNKVDKLPYESATKGCQMVLANLVMGNFDYDSISTELRTAPTSTLNSTEAYWVGMYEKDGELKFLNKHNSMDAISGRLCSYSSRSCQCVAYQGGRFYRDECDSRHKYACYMPKGGSNTYYDIDSLVASTASFIIVVAIVLSVVFVLAVLISLTVVLICCIRRKSAANGRRQAQYGRQATATATVSGAATGAAGYPEPPPYPVQGAAPVYTIPAPGATAPPYVSIGTGYENGAFAAGNNAATGSGGNEKPPAYGDHNWGGQQVPA